ncbi:hypothetical protein AXF42_Ash010370 [Apostasia shenzhenica]|uniref:Uncharacterized protein n=1 Tax=Apostasia shenzhenica TaxID=1088818 RepID=A0A2I0BDU4_9ASPA|nr:hypothetical protein AXF42_Ash010370 [Apostasia shenzhenica]
MTISFSYVCHRQLASTASLPKQHVSLWRINRGLACSSRCEPPVESLQTRRIKLSAHYFQLPQWPTAERLSGWARRVTEPQRCYPIRDAGVRVEMTDLTVSLAHEAFANGWVVRASCRMMALFQVNAVSYFDAAHSVCPNSGSGEVNYSGSLYYPDPNYPDPNGPIMESNLLLHEEKANLFRHIRLRRWGESSSSDRFEVRNPLSAALRASMIRSGSKARFSTTIRAAAATRAQAFLEFNFCSSPLLHLSSPPLLFLRLLLSSNLSSALPNSSSFLSQFAVVHLRNWKYSEAMKFFQ